MHLRKSSRQQNPCKNHDASSPFESYYCLYTSTHNFSANEDKFDIIIIYKREQAYLLTISATHFYKTDVSISMGKAIGRKYNLCPQRIKAVK